MPQGVLTPKQRAQGAEGLRNWWARLTPEQRSAEMRRRAALGRSRRNKKLANDPFGTKAVAQSSNHVTVKDRIAAIEAAVTALKADLGL